MDVQFFSKKVNELQPSIQQEMYLLFEKYYVDISFTQFQNDLSEKTHVLFIRNNKNELVGFSTIFRKKIKDAGPGTFLYSGDTVIREDYWGSKFLQKAFFWFILKTKITSPFEPVYWMLISKGFKTYLMMKKNFISCWPRREASTPTYLKRTQDSFYRIKFGDAYRQDLDLIIFDNSKGAVKGNIAAPKEESKKDLDIQYFLNKNPRYQNGEELACIAEIQWKDFIFHVLKYFIPRKYEQKIHQLYAGYRSRRTSIAPNT
jgi:hypothetical protein